MLLEKEKLRLNRSAVGALMVRMDIGDIPYVQSSCGREELIRYLYSIFSDTTTPEYNQFIDIDLDDIKDKIISYDEAIRFLRYYAE